MVHSRTRWGKGRRLTPSAHISTKVCTRWQELGGETASELPDSDGNVERESSTLTRRKWVLLSHSSGRAGRGVFSFPLWWWLFCPRQGSGNLWMSLCFFFILSNSSWFLFGNPGAGGKWLPQLLQEQVTWAKLIGTYRLLPVVTGSGVGMWLKLVQSERLSPFGHSGKKPCWTLRYHTKEEAWGPSQCRSSSWDLRPYDKIVTLSKHRMCLCIKLACIFLV